jgi:hypothetical protein
VSANENEKTSLLQIKETITIILRKLRRRQRMRQIAWCYLALRFYGILALTTKRVGKDQKCNQ